jgi:hypothetical protein
MTDWLSSGHVVSAVSTTGIPIEEFELRRIRLMQQIEEHSVAIVAGSGLKYRSKGILYVTVMSLLRFRYQNQSLHERHLLYFSNIKKLSVLSKHRFHVSHWVGRSRRYSCNAYVTFLSSFIGISFLSCLMCANTCRSQQGTCEAI